MYDEDHKEIASLYGGSQQEGQLWTQLCGGSGNAATEIESQRQEIRSDRSSCQAPPSSIPHASC
uniref:Uncharacterized protein n=1 Tax=Oryza glumipatula TaxID=40148 RepID=A0A0E0A786_9ORYZ